MSNSDTRTVALPAQVVRRVEDRLKYTDFDSTAEYTTFVLEQVLLATDRNFESSATIDDQEMTDRLESLGYL